MIVTMRTPLDMLPYQRTVLFGEYDHITTEGSTVAAVLEVVVAAGRVPVVVDVGANCGAVAQWLSQFNVPGGMVVHHYEPQAVNFAALSGNAEASKVRAICVNAAVVPSGHTGHFRLVHHGGNEGCYETVGCHCDEPEHGVPTVLANALPVCDILKLDCEGSELGIVEDYLATGAKPAYIAIEAHGAGHPETGMHTLVKSVVAHSYVLLSYVLTEGTGGQVGVLKFLRVAEAKR